MENKSKVTLTKSTVQSFMDICDVFRILLHVHRKVEGFGGGGKLTVFLCFFFETHPNNYAFYILEYGIQHAQNCCEWSVSLNKNMSIECYFNKNLNIGSQNLFPQQASASHHFVLRSVCFEWLHRRGGTDVCKAQGLLWVWNPMIFCQQISNLGISRDWKLGGWGGGGDISILVSSVVVTFVCNVDCLWLFLQEWKSLLPYGSHLARFLLAQEVFILCKNGTKIHSPQFRYRTFQMRPIASLNPRSFSIHNNFLHNYGHCAS
jgi:hypothetical protein